MRLLHIDSRTLIERSSSRMLTAYFVEQLGLQLPKAKVDYPDIAAGPLPHVSDILTAAMYTPPAGRTEPMREALRVSHALVDRLLVADAMARIGCANLPQLTRTLGLSSLSRA